MLFFRIQRELAMGEEGEIIWLPMADWLIVAATLMCLLLVIVPLVAGVDAKGLPAAASGSAAILVAGYILAILGHYRILFRHEWLFWGKLREGPRFNPEPSELILSVAAVASALLFFVWRLFMHPAS
jgi:hypothetical protein